MKRFRVILLAFLFLAASQGPLTPGTVTSDGSGDIAFANPSNAKVEDGVSATAVDVLGGVATDELVSTNYGFSIPLGSTINGVLAEWKASCTTNDDAFNNGQSIVISGSPSGAPDGGSNSSNLTSTLTFYSAGGATDLWGSALTPTNVNASDFGFEGRQFTNNTTTVSVDVMRMTVYYTVGGKKQVIGSIIEHHRQWRGDGSGDEIYAKEIAY